jgi:hypothetical protein
MRYTANERDAPSQALRLGARGSGAPFSFVAFLRSSQRHQVCRPGLIRSSERG